MLARRDAIAQANLYCPQRTDTHTPTAPTSVFTHQYDMILIPSGPNSVLTTVWSLTAEHAVSCVEGSVDSMSLTFERAAYCSSHSFCASASRWAQVPLVPSCHSARKQAECSRGKEGLYVASKVRCRVNSSGERAASV